MPPRSQDCPDVERLVPHRPPMLMIEEVVERGAEEVVCRGRLPAPTPFLLLELAAQATAVMSALEQAESPDATVAGKGSEAAPKVGYLAAIQGARFPVRDLPVDRPLIVRVRQLRGMPPLRRYAVRVSVEDGGVGGGVELVSATLTTYQAPD